VGPRTGLNILETRINLVPLLEDKPQVFLIVNPTRCSNFSILFYFWNNTLHVSDGLSVHHQDFRTVHAATGICQTGSISFPLASRQQYLSDIYLLLHVVLNSWIERPSKTCRVLSQK
jgi:hypothetical protein